MFALVLVGIALALLLFLDIYTELKKQKEFKNETNLKSGLVDKTIQTMYDVMGKEASGTEKIENLNNIFIRAFEAKYSSIVLFDGSKYILEASNIEEDFEEVIPNVANENIFRSNVTKNVAKYVVALKDKSLQYKSALERNIKSAIFSPIYYNSTYLGFWIIEDTKEHAFDGISHTDLNRFKHNLSLFIENIQMQKTIELAESTDKQTGFYNNLYLYSNSRPVLTANDTSAMSVICLQNIPDINEKHSRNLGNTLIIKISNSIKEIVSKESILIRYSGIYFIVITPGSNAQTAQPIMERVLSKVREDAEYIDDEKISVDAKILIHTFKKQNNIEKEIQKMLSFSENMKVTNTIKIV